MKIFIFSLVVVTASLNASASPWSQQIKAKLEQAVQKNFANKTQVGIVVGVVNGDETYVWGFGEKAFAGGQKPDGDTLFEMGSITKTYTATLLALEVQRGRVRLGDKLKMYWQELAGTDAGEITLEQLATHSSGLPRMPGNIDSADPMDPYKDYDEAKLFEYLRYFMQAAPGPYPYSYSNLGMGLLGYVLASKLNGQTYEQYLQKNLLQPLGLQDTRVRLYTSDAARVAQGYGDFFELFPFWDLNVLSPAGVLKSTVNDLIKYMRFNMGNWNSDLGRAAALAQTPRATTESEGVAIGLAWEVMPFGNYQITTHSGATGGFRAQLAFDREKRVGVTVLSNTSMTPDCLVSVVFGVDCQVPQWADVSTAAQKQVVGTFYSEALKMTAVVSSENTLLAIELSGQSKVRLFAKSDVEFWIPDYDARFVFQDASAGHYNHLTISQNGHDYEFVRQ